MANDLQVLLRVRYAECDAQQVVFNARYADYADLAATEFMRAIVGGYQELLSQGFDTQVVNLNIQWQRSAVFDDVLSLAVRVIKAGTTSYTMQIQISHYESAEPIATVEIVYVMVDTQTFTKVPIPLALKEKLLQGAKGVLVNQAG